MRLDPLSLPLRFDARDVRADGGVRQVELHRERVVLRRRVAGMRMAVNVRVCDFLGIGLRGLDSDAQMLALIRLDIEPAQTLKLRSVRHYNGLPIDARSITDEIISQEGK